VHNHTDNGWTDGQKYDGIRHTLRSAIGKNLHKPVLLFYNKTTKQDYKKITILGVAAIS